MHVHINLQGIPSDINPITKNRQTEYISSRKEVIYSIECNNCNAKYVGETGRKLHNRIIEHRRNINRNDPLSLIVQHSNSTGHTFNLNEPKVHYNNINNKYQRLIIEAIVSKQYSKYKNQNIPLKSDIEMTNTKLTNAVIATGQLWNDTIRSEITQTRTFR
ncbi:hypothetical protein LAZ67_9002386 [Cordylochernes scorpioides]|uniref:GIY-YIG domain-containing protein n=1 Tax=Cordylochernes scorpioides TaxID=51811 RepID=A0ABY6KVG3_9ARAC|nr:hypothetical protein LAZ67_9002386 [Cordylochernes scorpioides]